MKVNFFSITFWFNIFNNHNNILNVLQESLKDEYSNFNINNYSNNYLQPIITAVNNEEKTNMTFSQINFQYNMDKVTLEDLPIFKEKCLNLFDILTSNGINVLHSAVFINGELQKDNAVKVIANNLILAHDKDDDLVDINLKIGKKHEDLFYKVINILNKKQMKLPQKFDEQGRIIPVPLVSWHGALTECELLDVSYEINDKYLFDHTANYCTTEFYLNKMLYIIENNFESDIKKLLETGNF